MTEKCEGERGPEPGDLRTFTCEWQHADELSQTWEEMGWRFIGARSSAMAGRGLPRMVDVTMEYAP